MFHVVTLQIVKVDRMDIIEIFGEVGMQGGLEITPCWLYASKFRDCGRIPGPTVIRYYRA